MEIRSINNACIFIKTLLVSLMWQTSHSVFQKVRCGGGGQRSGWGVASRSLCTRDPSSSSCCCWALSRSSSLRRSRDSSFWCCSSCSTEGRREKNKHMLWQPYLHKCFLPLSLSHSHTFTHAPCFLCVHSHSSKHHPLVTCWCYSD